MDFSDAQMAYLHKFFLGNTPAVNPSGYHQDPFSHSPSLNYNFYSPTPCQLDQSVQDLKNSIDEIVRNLNKVETQQPIVSPEPITYPIHVAESRLGGVSLSDNVDTIVVLESGEEISEIEEVETLENLAKSHFIEPISSVFENLEPELNVSSASKLPSEVECFGKFDLVQSIILENIDLGEPLNRSVETLANVECMLVVLDRKVRVEGKRVSDHINALYGQEWGPKFGLHFLYSKHIASCLRDPFHENFSPHLS